MAGDWLSSITIITNFLCMAISLWFAIYLLARSPADPLTFRAVFVLLILAFYYDNTFTDMVKFNSETGLARSLAMIVALVVGHNFSHYLLPAAQKKKLYWVERSIVLLGVITIILLITAPAPGSCDPRYTCPDLLIFPWIVIDFCKGVFFFAILYNLWLGRTNEAHFQKVAFYEAILLSSCTVAYSLVSTLMKLDLPRFIPSLAMLAALALLLYSVAHDQTILMRRSTPYDLPITLLTITVIVAMYVLSAWQIGLNSMYILLLAVLAIFTHSAYDIVREFINRMFRTQEGRERHKLRQMRREAASGEDLPRFLKRGLAILCHNLNASNGLIALRQKDQYRVVASLHCLPVGWQFAFHSIPLDSGSGVEAALLGYKLWLVPAYAGSEIVGVVGVGSRLDQFLFNEEDFYWLEDIAEEIGFIISTYEKGTMSFPEPDSHTGQDLLESLNILDGGELLSKLAYKPDPELVKCVEESLRSLDDYSKLGKSPLASLLAIQAQDHIECGKQVQHKLIEIIEKLRPVGEPPKEPLPREWYAYTILHDAYVENRLTREIMSKLYISEGTYYRLRRLALRGVTRAMLEMDALA